MISSYLRCATENSLFDWSGVLMIPSFVPGPVYNRQSRTPHSSSSSVDSETSTRCGHLSVGPFETDTRDSIFNFFFSLQYCPRYTLDRPDTNVSGHSVVDLCRSFFPSSLKHLLPLSSFPCDRR